jgi:hypothetical protein
LISDGTKIATQLPHLVPLAFNLSLHSRKTRPLPPEEAPEEVPEEAEPAELSALQRFIGKFRRS